MDIPGPVGEALCSNHMIHTERLCWLPSLELKSKEWEARQLRKVYGVLKACDEFVKNRKDNFLIGGEFSVADVSYKFSGG